MAKRRYEQKNEEKDNAIRERASALKEKEKVRGYVLLLNLRPLGSTEIYTGYHGYVPAVNKVTVWMTRL